MEKVYERIAEYETRLAYLKGQTDTGGSQYLSKEHVTESEALESKITEMKSVLAEFEGQFCGDYPSLKPEKKKKSKAPAKADDSGAGCMMLGVIALAIAFVVFLVMLNQ